MDFGSWSPSHTILALFIVLGFVGQVAILFHRMNEQEKRMNKQSDEIKQRSETFFHALERLEERIDKRFVEMNQRLSDMQAEMNHRFAELNQRLSDMDANIRQLNQNHIDHLNRHHG